jgi:HEAT repeat protein
MVKKRALSERELEIQRVAARADAGELAVLLHSGWHHGKNGAAQSEKKLAAETILGAFQGNVRMLEAVTRELAASYAPSARQVACALLQELWVRDRTLTPLMIELTVDDDWEVREWAAGAYTAMLRHEFPANVPFLQELIREHPHESVLRQLALSIKQTAQARIPDSVHTLLELTALLMTCESDYVRKNLGPFAIGDGLLRLYPCETIPFLQQAAAHAEWPARWNAVMAFSAAQGAKHADLVYELLTALQEDSRPEVARAVKATAKNLAKRLPDDARFLSFFVRM